MYMYTYVHFNLRENYHADVCHVIAFNVILNRAFLGKMHANKYIINWINTFWKCRPLWRLSTESFNVWMPNIHHAKWILMQLHRANSHCHRSDPILLCAAFYQRIDHWWVCVCVYCVWVCVCTMNIERIECRVQLY